MKKSGCPPRGDIARLIEGRLDPEYSEEIHTHLKTCYVCESIHELGTSVMGVTRELPSKTT
jgi:hypothetical protein